MKRFTQCTFLLAWLVACESPAGPMSTPERSGAKPLFANVFLNESFPVANTLANPCPPAESVAFEGRLHVLILGEPDDFRVHTNTQSVKGIGLTSGDRYEVMENEHSETQITGTTETQLFNLRFRMIRQGKEDNFWLKVLLRFTFPEGTVEVIEEDIECRGEEPGTLA